MALRSQNWYPFSLMIEFRGVGKSYASPVLEQVSFTLVKGDFLFVVGDSGAGKSSLLKLLWGEERATQGSVNVLGIDPGRATPAAVQALRRKMGIVFQDLRLIEELSVWDNVALSVEIAKEEAGTNARGWKGAIDDALALVGLGRLSKKRCGELSGGEKSRVAAARAIVRNPQILIADEPTGNLDREQTWSLMDVFQKMQMRGTTVIMATHDREIVRRVRRRSLILKGGKAYLEEGLSLF